MRCAAENQMIVKPDAKRFRRLGKLMRCGDVVSAWRRVTRGMIMRQDQPGCAEPKRVRKNRPERQVHAIGSSGIFSHGKHGP